MKDFTDEQLVKKGKMDKDPFKMTLEEEKEWQKEVQARARERIFAAGQPLVYEKDGHMIAEHADGRIKIIR